MIFLFVLLLRRLHRSTRTYTLVPYSTLVPSPLCASHRARQTQTSAPPYSSLRRRRGEGDQPKAGGGEMRNLSPFPLHHRPRRRSPSPRSEEHTSELQSLMRTSYAVFCLKKKIHYYTSIQTSSPTYSFTQ